MEEIKQWFYQTDAIVGQSDLLFVIIKLEEYFRGTDYVKQAMQSEIDNALTTETIGLTPPPLPEDQYNKAGLHKISYKQTSPIDGDLGIYHNGRITAVYFDGDWWLSCSTNSGEIDKKIKAEDYHKGFSRLFTDAWRFEPLNVA